MASQINCMHCFIPPYIIEKIIAKGSPKQRERAHKIPQYILTDPRPETEPAGSCFIRYDSRTGA